RSGDELFLVLNASSCILKKIENGCLEPAEAEIESLHLRFGKLKLLWISLCSMAVDQRSAWIGEAEQFGCLVECFSRRIVDSFANHAHVGGRFAKHDLRVTATHGEAEKGK